MLLGWGMDAFTEAKERKIMGQIYKKIPEYLDQLGNIDGKIIEIGSSRPGDDQSSQFLYELADSLNTEFITCDIDNLQITKLQSQGIDAVCARGEDFLDSYNGLISIAYLDNFDWTWQPQHLEPWLIEQLEHYRTRFGIDMNNVASQTAHLMQAVRVEQLASSNSLIVFDDTWFYREWAIFNGKGGAAVPYLLGKGYKILYTEQYGTILGRFKNAT